MKSKKKFLLLGVGVMGALALGVGATSTFAWYTATASATPNYGDVVEANLNAGNATAVAQNYYLQVTFNATSNIAMTDYNGGLWAVRGVTEATTTTYYFIAAQLGAGQSKTGEITIASFEWYREVGCTNALSAGEKAAISAGTITLYFQGARARFVQKASQPTDDSFPTDFGTSNKANTRKAVSLTVEAGGAVSLTNKLWASISGDDDSALPTLGGTTTTVDTYSADNDVGDYTVYSSAS